MSTYADSDEIDLRVYIGILWKWRWLIIATVLIAAVSAGILSFFVMTPVYQASAQVMVPKDLVPADIIHSPGFLQTVIEKLGLPAGQYTPATLAQAVSIETSKTSSSLTTIKVENADPSTASKIANVIAEEFLAFVRDKNVEATGSSVSYLENKKAATLADLSAQKAQRDALMKEGGIEALQTEVDRLSQMTNSYKSEISSDNIRLKELQKGISELEAVLAATPKMVPGPLDWSGHPTEVPNATYQQLEQSLALKKVEMSELEVRIGALQSQLPSLEAQYNSQYTKLVSAQRQLEDLDANIKELNSEIKSLDKSLNGLATNTPQTSIVTQAVPPAAPIKPRKALNIAVAAVLGGFVSVFAVFFIEYWRSSREEMKPSMQVKPALEDDSGRR